jgi:hypothetical protein
MKKLMMICLAVLLCSSGTLKAQNNALGAKDEFFELLMQMGTQLMPPKNVGSYVMLQNLSEKIDDNLAYKYLWQSNQYIKPEETNCHPVGFVLNKENNIVILISYKGKDDNLFYLLDVQTFNYKTGKLIDQLTGVAGFSKDGSACNMQVNSPNLIEFRTVNMVDDTKIELKISNKGKFDRS